MIEELTTYKTSDGKPFESHAAAEAHQRMLDEGEAIKAWLTRRGVKPRKHNEYTRLIAAYLADHAE